MLNWTQALNVKLATEFNKIFRKKCMLAGTGGEREDNKHSCSEFVTKNTKHY